MWKVITLIMASLVFLTSGCTQYWGYPVQDSDFDITGFTWYACNYDEPNVICYDAPIISSDDGQLSGRGKVRIESKRQQLMYAKVLVNEQQESISSQFPLSLTWKYENSYFIKFPLQSLQGEIAIRVCLSTEESFTTSSRGVLCKTKRFPIPSISVAVSPDPVTFTCDYVTRTITTRNLTVANNGEIPIYVSLDLPDHLSQIHSDQPFYNYEGFAVFPDHVPNSEFGGPHALLMPGETLAYRVSGNPVPVPGPGTYSATGYISLFEYNRGTEAKFKKPFTLVTQVV
jgi:hypothetical protein